MVTLETERDFEEYVNNYSDYLEIVPIDNGEREVIEKERSLYIITPFLNTDRIIKVGDVFTKYIGTYIVKATDQAELQDIKSSSDVLESRLNYSTYLGSSRQHLNEVLDYEDENKRSGCKNDRKAILELWFAISPSANGYDVLPQTRAIAKRKGIPCIWYKHKTDITWNNFHFKVSVDGVPALDWQEPNSVFYDVKQQLRTTGTAIYSGSLNPAPTFIWTKQRSNIKTPGMGSTWLVVNL